MKKISIFIFTISVIFAMSIYAQDSTAGIPIGKKNIWRIQLVPASYGAIIEAPMKDESNDTMLEAKPFIGVGFDVNIIRRGLWGIGTGVLLYTNGDKIYPIVPFGLKLFGGQLGISIGYNLGKSGKGYETAWQNRGIFLLNYNYLSKIFQ